MDLKFWALQLHLFDQSHKRKTEFFNGISQPFCKMLSKDLHREIENTAQTLTKVTQCTEPFGKPPLVSTRFSVPHFEIWKYGQTKKFGPFSHWFYFNLFQWMHISRLSNCLGCKNSNSNPAHTPRMSYMLPRNASSSRSCISDLQIKTNAAWHIFIEIVTNAFDQTKCFGMGHPRYLNPPLKPKLTHHNPCRIVNSMFYQLGFLFPP